MWSLQKGVFGFVSFLTEVEYSKIVIMPNEDFDENILGDLKGSAAEDKVTAEGLDDDDDDNKNKKDPKKPKGKKKREKKDKRGKEGEEDAPAEEEEGIGKLMKLKAVTEIKELTCKDYHDKKRKLGFCKIRFLGQVKAIEYCMHNYCDSCC